MKRGLVIAAAFGAALWTTAQSQNTQPGQTVPGQIAPGQTTPPGQIVPGQRLDPIPGRTPPGTRTPGQRPLAPGQNAQDGARGFPPPTGPGTGFAPGGVAVPGGPVAVPGTVGGTNALPATPLPPPGAPLTNVAGAAPVGTNFPNTGALTNFPPGSVPTNFPAVSDPTGRAFQANGLVQPQTGLQATNRSIPVRTVVTPAQRQNIARLYRELGQLRSLADINALERQRLATLLSNSAMGDARPSAPVITLLTDSLLLATTNQALTARDRNQLAIDLSVLLNSARLAPQEVQRVVNDVHGILQNSGTSPQLIEGVVTTLSTLVAELQQQTGQIQQTLPGQQPQAELPASASEFEQQPTQP